MPGGGFFSGGPFAAGGKYHITDALKCWDFNRRRSMDFRWIRGMTFKRWAPLLLVILACGLALTGCAGCQTSAAYKAGAVVSGPFLAQTTGAYVQADATLDGVGRAERMAAVAELKAATQDYKALDFNRSAEAWAKVKPLFYDYTDADKRLDVVTVPPDGPSDRKIIQDTARRFDGIIEAERRRRALWFLPGYQPVPEPAPVSPTTQGIRRST
jgi:hypothetical protein